MKVHQRKIPTPAKEKLLAINNFKGINLAITPTQIANNESPDMLNFCIGLSGQLQKRTGYEKVFESLDQGCINGMFLYRKNDGTEEFLFAFKDKLYKLNEDKTTEIIYTGLNDHKLTFFVMNNKCYLLDGLHYLQYDGSSVIDVTTIAYIPTLFTVSAPTGSGKALEQWNLLGRGFKQSYSADSTTTVYQLCLTGLDSDTVKVWIDGVEKIEGTDFTVDRVTGKVTFNTAPIKGTDNVLIQAYKMQTGLSDRIKKCTLYIAYGGNNDNHIILSGNKDTPSVIYRSAVYDPTYFPENFYQSVGNTNEAVMGFELEYDQCVILKKYSLWNMDFELTSDGVASYPVRPLNNSIGCSNEAVIQLIENNICYLNFKGIYLLIQSTIRTEKNVKCISENVNKLLLLDNIKTSIDYDNKLILAGSNYCYIYDYVAAAWLLWDNIPAECFIEFNDNLYFGDSNGTIYRFKEETEKFPYSDNGKVINAYWKSKPLNFDTDARQKLICKLFATIEPTLNTSAYFYYVTNQISTPKNKDYLPHYNHWNYAKTRLTDRIFDAKSEFIDSISSHLFDYSHINYSRFSYNTLSYPTEFMMKVKAKKIQYYQFVVQNKKLNQSLNIINFTLKFIYQNYVK